MQSIGREKTREYKAYMKRLLHNVSEYYPQYEPMDNDSLDTLVVKYFNWVYYNNSGYLPQTNESGEMPQWLREQYIRWCQG